MKRILSILLVLALAMLVFTGCDTLKNGLLGGNLSDNQNNEVVADALWESATYLIDTELGEGAKTVEVEVKAGEKSITFTIHTDKETLGDAMLEHGLIAGEQGAYGLYVKLVNGIEADYDKDGTYWGFYKNGEMMMVGVDGATIADGEHYELVKE